MDAITSHLTKYIRDTGMAHYAVQDNVPGVVFRDEGEFVPLSDLGLNHDLGFFRRSDFPDEPTIAEHVPAYQIRRFQTADNWDAYALVDAEGEYGFLLGERWQMADAFQALRQALECNVLGEPIDDDDIAMGHSWLTTLEARERLHRIDPEEYPPNKATDQRLRAAGRRGDVLSQVSPAHGWRWFIHSLDEWAMNEEAHRPGPKKIAE